MDEIQRTNTTPADLLAQAIDKGLTVEALEKLMALQERWQATQARKEFFEALAKFQKLVPELMKSKPVSFEKGGTPKYYHATLSDIDRQTKSLLDECGLSKRWEIEDNKEEIKVTCLITHTSGHTEHTTMMSYPDDSGGKNKIQARGSTVSYLQRYTLVAALGLTTADSDIDGLMPGVDVDKLHSDYMDLYNKILESDKTFARFHPDNWKGERTAKNYMKAIGAARKKLSDLTPGKA